MAPSSNSSSSTYSTGSDHGTGGPYFLHIEGLPARYTWQDLKDLIRDKAAKKGVWTVMMEVYPRGRAAGTGHARIARQDEAGRLYSYLTHNPVENRMLRVHIWDISTSPPRFMHCNCDHDSRHHPTDAARESEWIAQMVMEPGWQRFMPISPPSDPRAGYAILPPNTQLQPRMASQPSLTPQQLQLIDAMTAAGLDWRDPSQRAHFLERAAQMPLLAPPAYAGNSAGLPVNVRNGAVHTESRGVFVSDLSYKATERDIRLYFSRAGNVTQVKLSKDEVTKKSKGNCIVQYSTAAEAQHAVHLLNRQKFMGRQLNLRPDRSRVPVDTPSTNPASQLPLTASGSSAGSGGTRAPTIVNGSHVR